MGKGWLYEGGICELMIVWWLGVMEIGLECEWLLISIDFYLMILEIMGGVEIDIDLLIDGKSFVVLLCGEEFECGLMFWYFFYYGN